MAKRWTGRSPSMPLRAEPLLLAACWLPLQAMAAQPPVVAEQPRAETPVSPAESTPSSGENLLYLEVVLNQQPTGKLLPFVQRDQQLLADVTTLRDLGFRLPAPPDGGLVDLRSIDGVQVQYDSAFQRLSITAPVSLLQIEPTIIDLAGQQRAPASSSPGLLFNYDVDANHDDRYSNITGYGELRASGGGFGVFSTSAVTRAFRANGDDWRGESVRLDSNWQLSFPDSMTRLVVGDTQTGTLSWTRGVRLGGIRFGRDFSLQPYRVTTPLPTFLGEVGLPSDIELFVNGIRQYNGELPVGPFQLATPPSFNGLGNAQLVITDAFGSVRTMDVPFYASQQLLGKGLSDWSVTAGLVREDFGLHSFSYADTPVGNADLRYGISDRVTLEAHAEGGDGLANAGAGAVVSLGRAGIINGSYAASQWHEASGGQTSWGYSWNSPRFNVSLESTRTHGDYRHIASRFGQVPARVSERALLGWNSARLGSFGTTYLRLQYPGAEATRYASTWWNRSFGRRWALNFTLNQNIDDSDDRSAYLGISVSLGSRRTLQGSLQRNGDRTSANLDLRKSAPFEGGIGWHLRASRAEDGSADGLAEADWLHDHGRVRGGIARNAGRTWSQLGASGGLVLMGGHVFAARDIQDAFAVVSTNGVADVPVSLENRLIGRTDENGVLLVTPLNAWQQNRLAIDPLDLPVGMRVGAIEKFAVPTDRAGTFVEFEVTPVRAALVVLHDLAGQPLPAGTPVSLVGQDVGGFVGYDGETYFDSLGERNTLRAATTAGACEVEFDYPDSNVPLPRIGPLQCNPELGQ